MALPRPVIQRSPAGLLALLGLKNGGQSPQTFGNELAPSFELSDWYLRLGFEQATQATFALPAAGYGGGFTYFNVNPLTVPNGEWWFCHAYGVSTSLLTAGDTFSGLACAFKLSSGGFILQGMPSIVTGATIANGSYAASASGFWLPPGSQLGFYWNSAVVAAAESMLGDLIFTRLAV
jgi:hypothetical protein